MTLDESKDEIDVVQDSEQGVSLIFDKRVANYLEGATLDFKKTIFGSRFSIEGGRRGGTC